MAALRVEEPDRNDGGNDDDSDYDDGGDDKDYGKEREDINRKKTFSFEHCPNHLNPPPDPNLGNLVLFFYVKNDLLRV